MCVCVNLWHCFDDRPAADQTALIALRHFDEVKSDVFYMLMISCMVSHSLSEHRNAFLDRIPDLWPAILYDSVCYYSHSPTSMSMWMWTFLINYLENYYLMTNYWEHSHFLKWFRLNRVNFSENFDFSTISIQLSECHRFAPHFSI